MSTTTMSIHRALAELKLLDKRIQRAVEKPFIGVTSGGRPPKGYASVEEFSTELEANLVSAEDLIERRNKIKAAIIASNAVTSVVIAGVPMTVAEAIDRRDTGLDYDKKLLGVLKHQARQVEVKLAADQERLEEKAEMYITNMFDKKDEHKQEEIDAAREKYIANSQLNLIDPSTLRLEIETLEKKIEDFELEVDFSLSESNTVTMITV